MSETTSATSEASDAELISAVRGGDLDAYGTLFGRHHDAALRLARQLVHGPDADDLVSEAFVRVMAVLQAGKGPDEFFRAYLLSSIRRLHIDRIRASKRVRPTGDEAELDRAIDFVDPAEMKFEQQAAATAFASLPERWQLVLWHLDVEGQKPAQIAPLLGMSANSVSALAYRAREGLRQAYLQGHLAPPLDESCRWTTAHLGQYVRKGLSRRDTAAVDDHLETCSRCEALHLELAGVNSHLSSLLAPALLGTAAAGYLSSTGSLAAFGLLGQAVDWLTRPLRAAISSGPAAATAVATVAVVAVGVVAASQVIGDDKGNNSAPAAAPSVTGVPDPTTQLPGARDNPTRPTPIPTPTPMPIIPTPTIPTLVPVLPLTQPPPAVAAEPSGPQTSEPAPTTSTATPPGSTATDYAVEASFIDEPPQFQRRMSIAVPVTGEGPDAVLLTLALSLVAKSGGDVVFRGNLGPGWLCEPLTAAQVITTLTCTRKQTGLVVPPLTFSLRGLNPEVTVTISNFNNVDDEPANDRDVLKAADWRRPSSPKA